MVEQLVQERKRGTNEYVERVQDYICNCISGSLSTHKFKYVAEKRSFLQAFSSEVVIIVVVVVVAIFFSFVENETGMSGAS